MGLVYASACLTQPLFDEQLVRDLEDAEIRHVVFRRRVGVFLARFGDVLVLRMDVF